MLGCVAVTTATTETAVACSPAVIVIAPEYVPSAKCDGSAVIERGNEPKAATESAVDENASQFPPEFVVAEAENCIARLLLLVMVTDCVTPDPFCVRLKLSPVGSIVTGGPE